MNRHDAKTVVREAIMLLRDMRQQYEPQEVPGEFLDEIRISVNGKGTYIVRRDAHYDLLAKSLDEISGFIKPMLQALDNVTHFKELAEPQFRHPASVLDCVVECYDGIEIRGTVDSDILSMLQCVVFEIQTTDQLRDMSSFTHFSSLREANKARNAEWATQELSLSFRGNELAGEAGEVCNVLKKLDRERMGMVGSRATVEMAAEELSDLIICADLVAMDLGVDFKKAVAAKFNATSEKNGLRTWLADDWSL